MGGRGPAPKPKHLRRRTNRKAGSTRLDTPENPKVPAMPKRPKGAWRATTRTWWRRVWTSPMSSQYLETDVDGLGRLAFLVDELAARPANTQLLAELRLQEARWGLSPLDRSRLDWELGQVDPETKPALAPATRTKKRKDPRGILEEVR